MCSFCRTGRPTTTVILLLSTTKETHGVPQFTIYWRWVLCICTYEAYVHLQRRSYVCSCVLRGSLTDLVEVGILLYTYIYVYLSNSKYAASYVCMYVAAFLEAHRGQAFPFLATSPMPWQWLQVVFNVCCTSWLWSCLAVDTPGWSEELRRPAEEEERSCVKLLDVHNARHSHIAFVERASQIRATTTARREHSRTYRLLCTHMPPGRHFVHTHYLHCCTVEINGDRDMGQKLAAPTLSITNRA